MIAAWWHFAGHRWYRKVRRRRGGVYLVRTRRHNLRPRWLQWLGMRENGYVGESVSFHLRQRDHLGQGGHGHVAKDWSDLDPVWHKVIPLPWWLCWKWVLRPLETLVMLLTAPRYNIAKNHWNPRRITPGRARAERLMRDRVRGLYGASRKQVRHEW
jgi:hypothetical protein